MQFDDQVGSAREAPRPAVSRQDRPATGRPADEVPVGLLRPRSRPCRRSPAARRCRLAFGRTAVRDRGAAPRDGPAPRPAGTRPRGRIDRLEATCGSRRFRKTSSLPGPQRIRTWRSSARGRARRAVHAPSARRVWRHVTADRLLARRVSAQRRIVSICAGVSRRSPTKANAPGSGSHGGIFRAPTSRSQSRRARARTSSYDSRLNGAPCPGRWQVAQCGRTIGATSLVYVGAVRRWRRTAAAAGGQPGREAPEAAMRCCRAARARHVTAYLRRPDRTSRSGRTHRRAPLPTAGLPEWAG